MTMFTHLWCYKSVFLRIHPFGTLPHLPEEVHDKIGLLKNDHGKKAYARGAAENI